MSSNPLKEALRPAYHKALAVKDVATEACGRRLSARSATDYRKVVLSCHFGDGYSCNPKYIAEALNRLYPGEFDLVLLVKKHDESLPPFLRQVPYGTREAQRELATARFWLYNFRNDRKFVPKRGDQVYIQTWHGAIGPKRIERDVEERLSANYVAAAQYDGSITDLMFANNDLYERIYRKSFWYSGPVVRSGAPRNRPLVLGDEVVAKAMRKTLSVPDGAAICLYAPTFRADGSTDAYRFDYEAVTAALEARFGRPFVFVYRLHPNLASQERPSFMHGLVDATGVGDQQDLLAASDVLISDYSSIIEDFCMTGRPGFVFASDIDAYTDDRGFYYPLESRPFPIARTSGELVSAVSEFDSERYLASVRSFFEELGLKDDGQGDEYVARIIHHLARPGVDVAYAIEATENGRSED